MFCSPEDIRFIANRWGAAKTPDQNLGRVITLAIESKYKEKRVQCPWFALLHNRRGHWLDPEYLLRDDLFRKTDWDIIAREYWWNPRVRCPHCGTTLEQVGSTKPTEGLAIHDIVEITVGPFKGEKARVRKIDDDSEEVILDLLEIPYNPIPVTVRADHVKIIEKSQVQKENA